MCKESVNKSDHKSIDELLDEYLEATKGKNHDMEDIMRDSDFLLELWKKEDTKCVSVTIWS